MNGQGGIGKSYLCRYLYHQLSDDDDYKHLAWIGCKSGIAEGLIASGIYDTLELPNENWQPENLRNALLGLIEREGKTLLVLDDLQAIKGQDAILQILMESKACILATSRSKFEQLGEAYNLSFLSPEACLKIFQRYGPANSDKERKKGAGVI